MRNDHLGYITVSPEDLGTGLDVPLSVRALDPYRWCAEEAEAPEALAGHYIAILALINC